MSSASRYFDVDFELVQVDDATTAPVASTSRASTVTLTVVFGVRRSTATSRREPAANRAVDGSDVIDTVRRPLFDRRSAYA